MTSRAAIRSFELANPLYKNASVSFYTVASGVRTSTLATLYSELSGASQLANPQKLNSRGQFKQPVYIDAKAIGVVSGISVPGHETGIHAPAEPEFRVQQSTGKFQYSYDGTTWEDSGDSIFFNRGAWVTATDYNRNDVVEEAGALYLCLVAHTSAAAFNTDLTALKWMSFLEQNSGSTGASLVGFIQSGTGAVATTVQAKLRERVSVFDFMSAAHIALVKANDIASQVASVVAYTAAIQAAIDAGTQVYFPAGTYLSNTLTLNEGNFIYGDGPMSIIYQNDIGASSEGVLYAESASAVTFIDDITIRDLSLVADDTDVFEEHKHLISLNGVRNALIDNCQIVGFRGDGIYIGSGISGGVERHNHNITVRNCLIDGIDNENRNGISVIDCNGLVVDGNTFQNCTKSTMPGSIDVEPDNTFNVCKNMRFINNSFSGGQGGVGEICLVLSADYTTKPANFVIANNIFTSSNSGIAYRPPLTNTTRINLVIANNTMVSANRPLDFQSSGGGCEAWGIAITGNYFGFTTDALIGFYAGDIFRYVNINGNTFDSSTGGISMCDVQYMTFANNIMATDGDVTFGKVGCATHHIACNNNISNGQVSFLTSGTDEGLGLHNSFLNNYNSTTVAHTFKAWRNDNCGSIVDDDVASAKTFNSATVPSDFPIGVSVAVVNGDTGVPSTGGFQGVLTNYVYTATSGYTKYRYQTYHHANNTTNLGSTWIRHATAADGWTSWYEIKL